jgi:y4mF family transcriptional regulator
MSALSRSGYFRLPGRSSGEYLPIGKFTLVSFRETTYISRSGNIMTQTVSNPLALGRIVRETRRALGLTQPKLALSAGVGVRFLVDIERGKPTAQIGKIMQVLAALGIEMQLSPPTTVKATDARP